MSCKPSMRLYGEVPMSSLPVLTDVGYERQRQENKWGEQNHDGGIWLAILTEEVGEVAQAGLDNGWVGNRHLREELVQVAAVAVKWIECIDRRNSDARAARA
jgi:NTP pyrophosphatase (non-canonical NTP hydrolase)